MPSPKLYGVSRSDSGEATPSVAAMVGVEEFTEVSVANRFPASSITNKEEVWKSLIHNQKQTQKV